MRVGDNALIPIVLQSAEEKDYSLYAELTLSRHIERIKSMAPRPIKNILIEEVDNILDDD